MTQADKLAVINDERRMLMEDVGISNMFELKYDPSLEGEIKKMNSCEYILHGSNFRVENQGDKEAQTIFEKVVAKIKNKQLLNEEHKILPERYHPGQTFVAWCDLTENCIGKYTSKSFKTFWFKRIYIFGPKGTYADSDYKYGKPGADCPNGIERTFNLCKGPEVPVKTTTPSKEMSAGNSIDADSAAPLACIFLIYSIILLVNIVNVY